MYKVLTYNSIAPIGLERLPRDRYEIASEIQNPDAIILRSYNLHGVIIPESVKAIGRAGAGTNNIPITDYSNRGIPVFNAPGANANAVKELTLAGMLLASRHICSAWRYTQNLNVDDQNLSALIEQGKGQFAGSEVMGKTLAVLGLGAIGVKVANAAFELGMNVIGYDPMLTIEHAWQLSSKISRAASIDDLISRADYISLHVPLNEYTQHVINKSRLDLVKNGAVLLNFSRDQVVDEQAVMQSLDQGHLGQYICDFPSKALMHHPKITTLPHLGASTQEAEDNCAIMVADQIRDYLEHGIIKNAVNLPDVVMPERAGYRISVVNQNVPNLVGQISGAIADAKLNILNLVNKSKGDLAYTLIDVEAEIPEATLLQIKSIKGILSARTI